MAPCTRPSGYLSPPVTRTSRRGSPSDRSHRSESADSSEKGCTTSSSPRSGGDGGGGSSSRSGSRPARKRASKPKVRTGCISCKRRHVKCDEGKPSCAECERLGLMCEGYAPPKVKKSAVRTERLLLPKLAPPLQPAGRASTPALPPADGQASILPMPSFGFELDDDDRWYFALFRDQVALELSPYHQSHFWTRTSLRDSMVNKCIRHSILSIGAYARALMELREGSPWDTNMSRPWWPPSVLNRHHQAALVHQAKALSHLRSDIHMYGIDSRLTMMATLLFIVFENMQGNYHSSGNLIRSGIKVLTNMRSADGGGGRESSLRRQRHRYLVAPRDEVNEMADMYTRHSVTYAYAPFPHGKFAYHLLFADDDDDDTDDERDEADADYFAGPYALSAPQTLEQARRTWDYLSPLLANFHSKAVWRNLNPDYDVDEGALRREQAAHLAQLRRLGAALESLPPAPAPPPPQGRRSLELLRLHHALATIFVSCCLGAGEEAYDGFLPQFEDCVRRGRAFVEAAPGAPGRVGFSNEVGILAVLAFAGLKCRARAVRLEVLELLGRYGWREGSWDSASLAYAVSGLMRLEGQLPEAEAQGAAGAAAASSSMFPPAEARYTWTNMFWDFENRQMVVEYRKLLRNEFGELDKVRCVMGA